jgi:acyl carrier protein
MSTAGDIWSMTGGVGDLALYARALSVDWLNSGIATRWSDDIVVEKYCGQPEYSVKADASESEILDWCMAYLAKTFKKAPERIDPRANFARLGMDSAASVFFVVELEEWLGIELPTEIVFTYRSPAELARHVAERHIAESSARGRIG